MIEWGDTEGFIVKTLLSRIVHMIEGHWVNDLTNAQLLDLIICVELKGNASETIFHRVFIIYSI